MSGLKKIMMGLAFLVGVGSAGAQQQAGPWSQLVAAQARLEVSGRQAEATAQAYLAAQKRFESGSVHFVDLNLAKTIDDRAQSNLVRAKYEYVFRKKVLDFYQDKPLTLQE